jgi:mannose/cellobiose epimerase-like protein (N-acyl-D-glucosamine 2-epimerase family)
MNATRMLGARSSFWGLWLAAGLMSSAWVDAAPLAEHARDFRRQLVNQIMPYWYDTTVDELRGGYLLADSVEGRGVARDKQLVSQSRMVWGFSHAHLKGLGDGARDYVTAARKGYLFLLAHFEDRRHGGFYWKTDLEGKALNPCKFLYGQAFVVYAMVEFHRATGERDALDRALALYRTIQKQMHDPKDGGWIEHTEADWRPLKRGDPRNEVEVVGYKSANAHLHWMEALAELYEATRDPDVRGSLEEALRINREYFYPADAGQSCFHRLPDWGVVKEVASAGLSYGHNVEFAWLMIRAEEVLGRGPSWDHFGAHIEHALKYGYDHERGGLFNRGVGDEPASDTSKVWWVQAEMMAALTDAIRHRPTPEHRLALEKLVHFVQAHGTDRRDGIWLDTVAADGRPLRTGKAHNWKTSYHDVRAMVKFVETFLTTLQ